GPVPDIDSARALQGDPAGLSAGGRGRLEGRYLEVDASADLELRLRIAEVLRTPELLVRDREGVLDLGDGRHGGSGGRRGRCGVGGALARNGAVGAGGRSGPVAAARGARLFHRARLRLRHL